MDIALEIIDTFVGDYAYAAFVPAKAAPLQFANATGEPLSTWTYHPATAYFTLQPSHAAYESAWPRDHFARQFISAWLTTWLFGILAYYVFASLSYFFIFDKRTLNHPKYLKNQIQLEQIHTMKSMPVLSFLMTPLFMLELRGYSKFYDTFAEGPSTWYNIMQYPFFILFTDFGIYWLHRFLHHPLLYKRLHKPHHKWIMPTPFASYAFHPIDGWLQGFPYHLYALLFPLHKLSFLGLFIFVNFWTILIHDGEFISDNPVINGAACHSVHHFAFNYNYGQYTTLWDRFGGSYRAPMREMFDKELKMSQSQWKKQSEVMEEMVVKVEGEDDRTYGEEEAKESKKLR